MWLLLRILTLIGVYLWKFFWRQQSIDSSAAYRDTSAVKKAVHNKGRLVKTYHGLSYDGPLHMQFAREKGWDSFCKKLGLAVEQQTGDAAFDRDCYITCDQPALGEMLHRTPAARAAVQKLFQDDAARIFTDGRNLWAEFPTDSSDPDAALASLYAIRAGLQSIDPASQRSRIDAFFWKALAVESLVWSIACYGIPGFIEFTWHRNTLYLDSWPIFRTGLIYASILFAGLFGVVVLLLRGSSRGPHIIAESFFVLLVGVPLSTVQVLSDININLDRSPPQIITPEVRGKYVHTTHGRHGTSYYYHLSLRPESDGLLREVTDLEVEYPVYRAVQTPNGRVCVLVHPGAAGFAWIEDIRRP